MAQQLTAGATNDYTMKYPFASHFPGQLDNQGLSTAIVLSRYDAAMLLPKTLLQKGMKMT